MQGRHHDAVDCPLRDMPSDGLDCLFMFPIQQRTVTVQQGVQEQASLL